MPQITVKTSLPADNSDGVELLGYDSAEMYFQISAGSGTACLIQRGPAGKWHQYGPSFTVDTTTAGQQVPRIGIPREKAHYQVLVTGGPTIDRADLEGRTRGR